MNSLATDTINKLDAKTATIGIVGLGYVGLPLIELYSLAGYPVVGFDVDQTKVQSLLDGESYIRHISPSAFINAIQTGTGRVTTEFKAVTECDAIILCVPTPLDEHREPDLSFVLGSLEMILPYLQKGQAVSLESTTYPGTTKEILEPKINASGFTVGDDVFLVYSPEREDPGNKSFTTQNIPKIVSGTTATCASVASALYKHVVVETVEVSSTAVAEMAKILENTYRAVNIAFVNELKQVAERMDIDIFEVIDAAATKPFGFTAFYPGPGLGGHCIPIDPFYLTWKAREYGITTRFIELAGEINTSMPDYVVERIMLALNNHSKAIKGSRLLILGAAYKKNVDDMRESPSMQLIEKLMKLGAHVDYSDPHVPTLPTMRKYDLSMSSVSISADMLSTYDCVVVSTDHDQFDWNTIRDHAPLIVDSRGRYKSNNDNIFRS